MPRGLARFVFSLLVCATVLACRTPQYSGSVTNAPAPPPPTYDGGAAVDRSVPVDPDDAAHGSANAYVTIVLFTDFRCPACARLNGIVDRLRDMYPWDVLRIVYKHYPSPLLAQSKLASTVGQGVFAVKGIGPFWKYRDLALREQQPSSAALIRQWALAVGMTTGDLDTGLQSGTWADKVERDTTLARRLGVTDPPAAFVNGADAPLSSFDAVKSVVDVELAKAKVLEQSGVPRSRIYAEAVAANSASLRAARGNELEDPKIVWRVPVGTSPVRGKTGALVTIVEFSTFDCPACKSVAATLEKVRVSYGDKVRVVWKDAPPLSHQKTSNAVYLARAARAQKGDAGFWDMHDRLFASAKLDDTDLDTVARGAGLDPKIVMAQVRAQTQRKDIEADLELAEDVEVSVPPHLFINGRRLIGEQPAEKLNEVIDEEVRKAESLLRSGIEPGSLYDWFIKDGLPSEPVKKNIPINPNAPFKGPANAQLTIQEFGDFQCAQCRRAEAVLDEVMKAFPGAVRLMWRDLPSSRSESMLAAEAAREAYAQKGSDAFWKWTSWAPVSTASVTKDDLESYAKDIGLDVDRLRKSLQTHAYRNAIDADVQVAQQNAIVTAPTFVIGPYVVSGVSTFARLKRIVGRALAEAPPVPKGGGGRPLAVGSKFSVVDLVVGTGPEAHSGDEVVIHYRGRLADGTEFDSTYKRGPQTFRLGNGSVIEGWERGIPGMRIGGKRRITVPPDLAFGNHGVGKQIPPNTIIVFDIQLVGIN